MSNLLKSKFLAGVMIASVLFVGILATFAVVKIASAADGAVTMTLKQGMSNIQVKYLQQTLNEKGFTVAASGVGSAGSETSYFGSKTKLAVMGFQATSGLTADGIFGPLSRAALAGSTSTGNFPAGCTSNTGFSTTTGASCATVVTTTYPAGCTSAVGYSATTGLPCSTVVVTTLPAGCTSTSGYSTTTGASCLTGVAINTTGVATAGLSTDTPAAQTLADAGNANFTKFYISAGATNLSVNSIRVTRYGLSTNASLENVKILDGNGVPLTSSGTLNSNGQVNLTFTPSVSILAGATQQFYIRAGYIDGLAGGMTASLGIAQASDINASQTVGGTFPINGNTVTSVLLTIGGLSVTNDGTVTDDTPDVGDTNVVVNKFKLSVGSTEAVTVNQISVEKKGSAGADDTTNIELFDVTNNVTLGTVASWSAQGLATFNNLNLVIAKGGNLRLKVMVDVVDGSGLTVNADVTDGTDVRVIARGNDFGFYVTPTITGGWDGAGAAVQTIAAGAFNVTKSTSTPATGNVTKGTERLLGVFDVVVNGEAIRTTSFKVSFNLDTGGTGGIVDTEISNARLKNFTTGAALGGPNTVSATDYIANGTTYEATSTFTDTIEFPVGTTKVAVYADISDDVSGTDTLQVGIADADTDLVAKGITSNDTVTATPVATVVNANVLTIKAGALAATTLTSPAARDVVKGTADFVWAEMNLSAAGSGEDVNVTALTLEATVTNAAMNVNDLDNFEIWADLTSAGNDSVRGDRYETIVSDTKQWVDSAATDELLSFNLTKTILVPKDGEVRIAAVGDLSTGASTVLPDAFAISLDTDAGDVTADGATTGSTINVQPTGTGQIMTVIASGVLTVSVDASSPKASVLLDGSQNATKPTLAIFRLAASNAENLDLDSFKITDGGSDTVVDTYYFQAYNKNGTTKLGSEVVVAGAGTATANFVDGAVTIPANDYILMKVMGVMADVDTSASNNESTVQVTIADDSADVLTTGIASGIEVGGDATDTSNATVHTVFQSYPTFAWVDNSTSANGTLVNSSKQLIGKLKITAVGNSNVTFVTGSGNEIIFQLAQVITLDDGADETMTFEDELGTTLDTVTVDDAASGTDEVTVDFSSSALTIPAGGVKYIYVYYDTSDLDADGDSVQVSLDRATAADLSFSIDDDAGDYNAQATVLWRSDYMGDNYSKLWYNPS